jgi:hypothetical protein
MSADLYRRYARLLRAYPAEIRRTRGAEMLSTLVEVAPEGRHRPELREAAALIVGGLRERAGANHRRTRGAVWLSALRMAVLMLLAYATVDAIGWTLAYVVQVVYGSSLGLNDVLGLAAALPYGVAIVSVARNRYRTGVLAAAVGFGLAQVITHHEFAIQLVSYGALWPVPLAMLLAVPLLLHRPVETPVPLRWLLAVPAAAIVLPSTLSWELGLQPWAWIAMVGAGVVWAAVDVRVPIAVGLMLVPLLFVETAILVGTVAYRPGAAALSVVAFLVPIATLLGLGAHGARRVARA